MAGRAAGRILPSESLREALLERKAVGLRTRKQAKQLVALGIDPRDLFLDEAKELLREHKASRRVGDAGGGDADAAEPAD